MRAYRRPWLPAVALVSLSVLLGGLVAPSPAAAAAGWRWPLAGQPVVARGFDPPALPWGAGHRGVDLRGRPGARVYAAGAGVVGYAGLLAGRGVVTVHHRGGLETTYEPVSAAVIVGAVVAAGAVLGRLEVGHGDCGPGFACLHWGLRRGADYLDPLSLLGTTTLRLYPVWSRGVPAAPPRMQLAAPPPPANHSVPGARAASFTRRPRSGSAATAAVAAAGALAALGSLGLIRRRRVSPQPP